MHSVLWDKLNHSDETTKDGIVLDVYQLLSRVTLDIIGAAGPVYLFHMGRVEIDQDQALSTILILSTRQNQTNWPLRLQASIIHSCKMCLIVLPP